MKEPIYIPDFGKIPPQAVDVEEALLGICLMYPDAIYDTGLKSEMFYKDSHRKIYEVITELSGKGLSDIVSVTNRLRDKGELEAVGGPVYMTKLTGNIYTDQMTSYYSLIVKEKYIRREYIRISSELQGKSFDDSQDLADIVEYAESSLFNVSNFSQNKDPELLSKCIDDLLIEVQKIYTKEKSLVGVPSGFTKIDRLTGGWDESNLIIVAGRPSMGKTSLALSFAKGAASLKYPVGIFSLEMSRTELASRYLAGESGYTNTQIRSADLNFDKLVDSSHEIASLPIYIDDTAGITLFELRSKVKKLILRNGIKLVIVDYLQLMSCKADSREQEISRISRGLKAIAKEFHIPVIAVSQLNREVESRADRRPQLSDLRESGAIEQDADQVIFVMRPALNKINEMTFDNETLSTKDMLVVNCAKNRNGCLFTIPLYHNESLTVIRDEKIDPPQLEQVRF